MTVREQSMGNVLDRIVLSDNALVQYFEWAYLIGLKSAIITAHDLAAGKIKEIPVMPDAVGSFDGSTLVITIDIRCIGIDSQPTFRIPASEWRWTDLN